MFVFSVFIGWLLHETAIKTAPLPSSDLKAGTAKSLYYIFDLCLATTRAHSMSDPWPFVFSLLKIHLAGDGPRKEWLAD
jgi:hypothetical protein